MKKIFFILLSCIVLTTATLGTSICAESNPVEIVSPENESEIICESTEVTLDLQASFSKLFFELDGEIIAEDSCTLSKEQLTLGAHTLTVYALMQNGSIEKAVSRFTVRKQIEGDSFVENFSSVTDSAIASDEGYVFIIGNDDDDVNRIKVQRRKDKDSEAECKTVEGREGEDDVAVNFTSKNKGSDKPFADIFFKENGGEVILENDICPNVACPIKYDLKTYVDGKATAWGSLGLDNGEKHSITVFGSNGYLFGSSSNAAYSAGNWYRTKLYFDFNKKEITTTVTDIESGLQLYNKTCDIPEGFNKIAFLRIEWTPSGVADSGFSLDNVNVLQSSLYSGIKDVKFLYGENESEDIKADSEKLTGIKLTMNEPLLSEADAKNFLVYDEEGKSVPVSSVTCSDALSAIVTLGEKLKPGSKYFADVKLAASFEGDEASEFDVAKTAFETMATGFAVSDAELTVGDDRFLSPLQLNGKALSAHVNFVNDGEADRSFTTVMTVRSGGLLFDLSVHEVTVPANSTDFSATFTSNVLSGEMDDAMIQLIFVDELKSSKSLIKTVTLNY